MGYIRDGSKQFASVVAKRVSLPIFFAAVLARKSSADLTQRKLGIENVKWVFNEFVYARTQELQELPRTSEIEAELNELPQANNFISVKLFNSNGFIDDEALYPEGERLQKSWS